MFIRIAGARGRDMLALGRLPGSRWLRSTCIGLVQAGCACVLGVAAMNAANAQALTPGQVIGWGYNEFGLAQLPIISPPLNNVASISSSQSYTAALRNNGAIVVWGSNPPAVFSLQSLNDFTAIGTAPTYLMVLRRNGTVAFAGDLMQAGAFAPGYLTDVTAIATHDLHAMALRRDGTVIDQRAADGLSTGVPAGLTGVKAIAAGYLHGLALKTDGTVVAWGDNSYGQSSVPIGLDRVVAIAANFYGSYALKDNGSVVAWGLDFLGVVSGATGLTDIKAISVGLAHGLGLAADGTVKTWGDNGSGNGNVPPGITNVKTISAGRLNSFALNPAPLLSPYTFSGFQRPVDGAPTINIGRAGRFYPVKWQLKDGTGGFVSRLSAFKSLTSSPARCGAFLPQRLDLLETRVTGPTGLTYDSASNQYVFNWKAPSLGCYTLFLTLDNNQVYTANFIIL